MLRCEARLARIRSADMIDVIECLSSIAALVHLALGLSPSPTRRLPSSAGVQPNRDRLMTRFRGHRDNRARLV